MRRLCTADTRGLHLSHVGKFNVLPQRDMEDALVLGINERLLRYMLMALRSPCCAIDSDATLQDCFGAFSGAKSGLLQSTLLFAHLTSELSEMLLGRI